MGSGKTTLIKELCLQIGVISAMSSPTFSLINEYETNSGEVVYHFDFYRLEDEQEAFDIVMEMIVSEAESYTYTDYKK